MITYNSENIAMPKLKKRETTAWIRAVAQTYGYKVGDIGYMFVNDEKILEVNSEDKVLHGDLVISLDTVRSNAELFNRPYEDELYRVIIHGILHLCGINDKGPGEREIMEAAENKALALRKGSCQ